ncbi:MAG: hypothetical protein GKC53_04900 [Neisseriaceae bacterium]|nr:MAG: hypothetical protein GKC53_04900 [Neisseriaceae bacterium]
MKISLLTVTLFLSVLPNLSTSHDYLSVANSSKNISPKNGAMLTPINSDKPVIKLYPQIRIKESNKPSFVPMNLLKNFMTYPTIIENDEIKNSPYIIGNSKNTYFYLPGDRIYANNLINTGRYIIYRPNKDITDPETGKSIGQEIVYVGEAKTIEPHNINRRLVRDNMAQEKLPQNERYSSATILGQKAPPFIKIPTKMAHPLIVTKAVAEISKGDKLLLVPENSNKNFHFTPHPAANSFQAQIIHVFEGIGQHIGKYQTVLLNKGTAQGLDRGAIVSIYEKLPNTTWVDSSNIEKITVKNIAFPVNLVGKAIVYNLSDNMAYALIIENYDNAYIQIGNFATGKGQDLEDIPEYEPH